MKRLTLVAIPMAVACLFACKDSKPKAAVPEVVEDTIAAADHSVCGRLCGEGTSMNTLQLVTAQGDTLVFMLDDGNRHADVQGGLGDGDSMVIVKAPDGAKDALPAKVVNVTSLMGKWGSLERHFTLLADGTVQGNVREPRPYTRWTLFEGRLILSQDTFDIVQLGPDSLYLKQGDERIGYRRLGK